MIPSCHDWEAFRARIVAAPMSEPGWGRIFPGNVIDGEPAACGRGLPGLGKHGEPRDTDTHAAREVEAMKGEMPDVLKEFSF